MAYAPPYGDPYARPPYERGPYGAPPPLIRPPAIPPPPLPPGWRQEWEPNVRRAFWVEEATGRSQWEPPYVEPAYGYENRGPPGEYYAGPPGPPPVMYEERTEYVEEKKHSNAGKYLAGGVAGLAVGGLAGAFLEHEHDENEEREDQQELVEERDDAYDDGREDQSYQDYREDDGW